MLRPSTAALLALLTCSSGAGLAHAQDVPSEDALTAMSPAEIEQATPDEEEEETFGEPIPLYDPSGRAMRSLHDALRRADAGVEQARLVFYGASHVAADFWSNDIRQRLQARFGDAGHGFLMPVRAWRSYRHLGGVQVQSSRRGWESLRIRASSRDVGPLGVAGMAVDGSAPTAWGRIDTGDNHASLFRVLYLEQPQGGSFDVLVDGERVARIATSGAEPRAAVHEVHASDAPHQLEVRLRGDGPVRLFGVSIEREAPGVIVDTMGLNGARASAQLLWTEEIHQAYLRRLDPSLVVLAYGTNEAGDDDQPIARYERRLRRVVARVRGTVPNASCLLVGPSDRPIRTRDEPIDRPRTHQIIDVQRRVSRDFGCAFFDLVAFGGGPLSMPRWAAHDPPYAQRDLVHYTVRGYHRLGQVLGDAIMADYDAGPATVPPSSLAER
ncbi:MAG: GDSL-type esterase/lipase family protein [Sandaracinaceae bacterium]